MLTPVPALSKCQYFIVATYNFHLDLWKWEIKDGATNCAISEINIFTVLKLFFIAGNQYWQYEHETHTLRHGASRRCLAINSKKDKLVMEECNQEQPRQRWRFQTFNKDKVEPVSDDEEEP